MITNQEVEKLVLDYCNAASNLYYALPVKKILEIYNMQNKPLSEAEFSEILEKILMQPQFFDVFSKSELDTGEEDNAPILEKELLSEHLYCMGDFESYYELQESACGMPYHILDEEHFLKYADEQYVEKTLEFIAIRAYFRNLPGLTKEIADDLAHEAVDVLRIFDGDPGILFQRMDALEIMPKNESEEERLTELLGDLMYTIRRPAL